MRRGPTVALDPYRRTTKAKYRRGADDGREGSRVPMIVSALGLVVMLALVYNLGVMSIRRGTAELFAWNVQSPP